MRTVPWANVTIAIALLWGLVRTAAAAEPYIERDVPVPMHDGTVLRAIVLRPAQSGRYPTLVYRTPYGAANALEQYTTFRHAVERGYAVVIEDVRGRYASQGVFEPYRNEGRDGFRTIEWAARQRWSNGHIGTFGLSYPGAVQWLAALERPPHLLAMVPAMTFASPRRFFYANGSFDLSWIDWIWNNIAPDVRERGQLPGPRTPAAAQAQWEHDAAGWHALLPLQDLPVLKDVAPYYYQWLATPPEDASWNWAEITGRWERVGVAVLNISGWYDDYYGPDGATRNFNGLVATRPAGEPRSELLIGPWVHGGTEEPRAGERSFPKAAAIDYDATVLDFLDHFLRGVDNGVEHRPPVRYYVMGADAWRTAASWPPAATNTEFYLTTAAAPGRGGLERKPGPAGAVSRFVSDPADPVTDRYWQQNGAHDYRELAARRDVLTFETAPLREPLEVTGPIVTELQVACDCTDFDLWARLYDVDEQGAAWNLMTPGLDHLRASYRDPAQPGQKLTPGTAYRLRIEGPVTSNLFKAGHRIRLQLSGAFAPVYSRNLQTGASERTTSGMQRATLTVDTGGPQSSRLVLPVVH